MSAVTDSITRDTCHHQSLEFTRNGSDNIYVNGWPGLHKVIETCVGLYTAHLNKVVTTFIHDEEI